MNEEIKELTIIAELTDSGTIVGCIDKTFFMVNSEQTENATPKGLDEILTEFLQELETKAAEKNFRIKKKESFYTSSLMSLLLFFTNPDGISAKLKVPVEPVEKVSEEAKNGRSIDNK